MLVIGLSHFGKHLALKLAELGNEVMVVDKDEDAINRIAPMVTRAEVGDCMEEDVLRSIGARNFDICFVCISDDFQASLETTLQLKELEAAYVVAKTDREVQAKFLYKIGADEVIFPERDMAYRAAMRFSVKNAIDYIELTPEYAIFEMLAPSKWVGKTVKELQIRTKYNVDVIGVKEDVNVTPLTDAEYVFQEGEHLLVSGSKHDLMKLVDKN
jgi:trk system potassium uptake protein TrkA